MSVLSTSYLAGGGTVTDRTVRMEQPRRERKDMALGREAEDLQLLLGPSEAIV